MPSLLRPRFVVLSLAGPFIVAVAVFGAVGLSSEMGVGGTWTALVEQSLARRHNPLLAGALGLVPVLFLLGILALGPRWLPAVGWGPAAGWSGLAAVALVLGWAHAQFWPLFLPDRVYPGFPHGLELIIAPLVFAPLAAALGVGLGLVVGRTP